jgi:phenylpyruvate tautomerase
MPYLNIQSNQSVPADEQAKLMADASALVAAEIGKPEKYVMVALDPTLPMSFGGSDAPCAYLELKSIGLPETKCEALSSRLCDFIHQSMGIATDRIYIEFTDAPRSMWGWNKGTF